MNVVKVMQPVILLAAAFSSLRQSASAFSPTLPTFCPSPAIKPSCQSHINTHEPLRNFDFTKIQAKQGDKTGGSDNNSERFPEITEGVYADDQGMCVVQKITPLLPLFGKGKIEKRTFDFKDVKAIEVYVPDNPLSPDRYVFSLKSDKPVEITIGDQDQVDEKLFSILEAKFGVEVPKLKMAIVFGSLEDGARIPIWSEGNGDEGPPMNLQ